jgi:serine/threonine protein kinase
MGPVAVVAAALVPRSNRVVSVVTMTLLAAALCWPPAVALVSSAAADPESGRDVQLFSLRRGSTAVVSEAAEVVIPTLSCDNPPRNLTKCQLDDCGQRMEPLIPCLTYLQSNTSSAVAPRPSSECCKALQRLDAASPTCFCYVTFYPPPDLNISLVLQQAMPSYCNITTDICHFCPRFLNTPDTRITCISSDDGPAPALAPEIPPKHVSILPIVAGIITALLLGALAVFVWLSCRRKKRAWRFPDPTQELDEILKIEGKPTLYSYNVLKTATKNFHMASKLGEGGFGAVYKGVLPDGTEVAVKQLSISSRQGQEEFLNEVMLITGVQHRNLVKLRGCCLKGDERLLVYEFLANRSLHQALFDETHAMKLNWPTRLKILVGTARGLAYLHEGCQTRIIHRDIKASNILLDKDLNPKIADFGLARLFQDSQSHVSTRVAGTVGYLAPEYAMRGQLTEKADVFSFGIVALELVSGRGNLDLRLPPEMAYLLDWTWHLHENKRLKDIVDPTLLGDEYSEEEAMRVVDVALHCTQSVGTMRPTMTRVVELLTHGADAEIPEVTGSSKPRLFTLNNLAPGGTTLAWSNNNSKIDSKHDSPPESEEQEGSRASIPSAAANLVEPR